MRALASSAALLLLGLASVQVHAQCPYMRNLRASGGGAAARAPAHHRHMQAGNDESYRKAVEALDWAAVKKDLATTLTTSQDWWPADFGNYGPLMIRLAWHCAGSYRAYDGLGGCDGARQRFDPERSWPDNTNLDKARRLLEPIKEKYGEGLSWGDLIILAGNVAIETMGGPVLGFCAGRVDDADGTDSELLGPTAEQVAMYPCLENGNCSEPLGADTIGLIYVNPEGPMGKPDPNASAIHIRDVFGRMSMNDSETVALIGGGHAFGKAHGACPAGAGPSPKESPDNPWPGKCGTGKGNDTFTSGFEGSWTHAPTQWDNGYFRELYYHDWNVHTGPGGHKQWHMTDKDSPLMMLTTDIALVEDPEYQKWVELFLDNQTALDVAFSHAWYKLTTRDMGPVSRCLGPDVPPAQDFQNPLPPPPTQMANFSEVKAAVRTAMKTARSDVLAPDTPAGYSSTFMYLAYQCASTFRRSDYQGGCNGARIRFKPESEWKTNKGMDAALKLLEPVKEQFGSSLTWADLIVLAGIVAVEDASDGAVKVPFCGGRSDAADGNGSASLKPTGNLSATAWDFRWKANMLGLTPRQMVALTAMPKSPSQLTRMGFVSGNSTSAKLSNGYFNTLLNHTWEPYQSQYKAKGADGVYITPVEFVVVNETDLRAVAKDYAADNAQFLKDFSSAWVKLMNNDRFDGPTGNVCGNKVALVE